VYIGLNALKTVTSDKGICFVVGLHTKFKNNPILSMTNICETAYKKYGVYIHKT